MESVTEEQISHVEDLQNTKHVLFIKSEISDVNYELPSKRYADITVKEECCNVSNNLMYSSQQYYDINIKDEPKNNLLRASVVDSFTSTLKDGTEVKQEDLTDCTSVPDPLNSYIKAETDVDIKEEFDNNLLRTHNTKCFSTVIDDPQREQKGSLEILTTEDPKTIKNIENILTNTSSSGPVEHQHKEGTVYCNDCNKPVITEEKPYSCDVCHTRYSKKSHLEEHKLTHTGDKLYVCDICQKKFSKPSYLARHERTHTAEKGYVCEVCHKICSTSHNLDIHKRSHTAEKLYVCDVCPKKCSTSSHLETHRRSHRGEKSHVCNVCQRAFNRSSNLDVHKRTHTGEKSYVCDVCPKAFNRLANLQRHKRTHPG